ncbi:CcdB family protein, partial [Marinobacter excellens]|uniref:CcdB family protein n=1 Tax=Marinobacter excellens TaxID=218670 RepID=UPI001D0D328B
MARFDIFENKDGAGYLLDVQSDLLSGLNTRVVVPLLPKSSAPTPAQRLNPVFNIEGQEVVMSYCQIWCMTIRQRSCQIDLPPVFHPETVRYPRPASVG